jgi:epimerase EvaD
MFIFEELNIRGVWLQSSSVNRDKLGFLREIFGAQSSIRFSEGIPRKSSQCFQFKRVVLGGIHPSLTRCGQAKLVTCVSGRIRDVAVGLRVNSPTLGEWLGVELNFVNGNSLFLGEGIGHEFYALEKDSS